MAYLKSIFYKGFIFCSGSAAGVLLFTNANLKPDNSVPIDTQYNIDPKIKYTYKQQWDDNWDFRLESSRKEENIKPIKQDTEDSSKETEKQKVVHEKSKRRPSRNIILIRHGQYDTSKELDSERKLTSLGRVQAEITGERLNKWLTNVDTMHVSTMCRAVETADLIVSKMGERSFDRKSCQLLCEGAPYPPDPLSHNWQPERWQQFFTDGPRIEAAFRKYFYRPTPEQKEDTFEIVVCHANVIRYFVCRALQFPREGWLRMSLGNASVTWLNIRANGRVSLRSLGDVGHFQPNEITFG